jgi:hypothetical protein
MNRRARWTSGLALGLVALTSACNNEVIYVYAGSGGAGGAAPTDAVTATASESASSSAASSSSEATGASVTASTGSVAPTGPMASTCELVCSEVATCTTAGDAAACAAACEAVSPTCKPQHQAWLQCLIANGYHLSFGCPAAAACEPLLWPYLLCQGGCAGGSCSGSPSGSCGCNAACGEAQFDTSCFPTEPGIMACQCKQDGQIVGNCFGPSDPKACDAARSCCSSLLFADG